MTNPEHKPVPALIAHRGWASQFPENTLPAVMAALSAGACFIEVDIQLTRDGIPVLLHDANTWRTTGHDALITDLTWQQVATLDAGYPEKFGRRYRATPVATLYEFVELISHWPRVTAFVEIKEESLQHFGIEAVMDTVINLLDPLQHRAILISYHDQALDYARHRNCHSIGWVVRHYSDDARLVARTLQPDFIFCNHEKLGKPPYWQGPWQWACYEITEPDHAMELAQTGIQLIETMAIGDMLQDARLATKSCCKHAPL